MIRLILVDDHRAIAAGLSALLEDADIAVVGTAHDATTARTLIQTLGPDVVLCDVRLETRTDGLEVLADHATQVPFIMLSAYLQPHNVLMAVRHGARGFLSKMAGIDEILAAIRAVAAGGSAFPEAARDAIRMSLPQPTAQELAILILLARGKSSQEIARSGLAGARSVEGSLRRLFARYGVTNRVALVSLARQQGWLDDR